MSVQGTTIILVYLMQNEQGYKLTVEFFEF